MYEQTSVVESLQKNPFGINCKICNENAQIIKDTYKLACNCVVHGYGDTRAKIVIIGEGPGKNGAAITGIPFTRDESGKRVQISLIRNGYSSGNENEVLIDKNYIPKLKNIFITNLFRFYGYKKLKGNTKKNMFNDALNHLKEEIDNIDNNHQIKIIIGKITYKNLKKIKFIDSNTKLIEHPSTYNHKTREEWIKLFNSCINNL